MAAAARARQPACPRAAGRTLCRRGHAQNMATCLLLMVMMMMMTMVMMVMMTMVMIMMMVMLTTTTMMMMNHLYSS